MAQQRTEFLLPVGRIVQGSLYEPNDTDAEGNPLKIKTGPNAGQDRVEFYFAVAVPKLPGQTHWAQVVFPPGVADGMPEAEQYKWGQTILTVGAQAFPQLYQGEFSWKITDGDSTKPNKKGKRPCDTEGFPGHWIVRLSGGYAPKVYQRNAEGVPVLQPQVDFVKPGYYVQVGGNVSGNGKANQPGVYLNHGLVLFVGYGPEIYSGPDASAVFGKAATSLPAGVSAMPVGVATMPVAAAVPAAVGLPALPVPASLPAVGLPALPGAAPAPVVVTPNPAFLAGPAAVAPPLPPAAPAVPVPPPAKTMTPKAAGVPYATFIAQNWTDALLVEYGYMLP